MLSMQPTLHWVRGATPYTISDLDALVDNLNFAFEAGSVGVWAQDHLVNGPCP